jgi:hypothetical protein
MNNHKCPMIKEEFYVLHAARMGGMGRKAYWCMESGNNVEEKIRVSSS